MSRCLISIVIPAFNEQRTLGEVLDELLATCPSVSVVVVDDGSTDRTSEVAASRPVHLLHHATNLGQGAALKTGFDYALAHGADILVTFDADGQMFAGDVARICEPIAVSAYDVVLGTRFADVQPEGMTRLRRLTLRLGIWFTRVTSRLPVTDTYNGLRALSRAAAEQIRIDQNRMGHGLEIIYEIARLKLRWKEVPVSIRYTEYSKEKGLSSWAALDIVADLWGTRR